VSLRDGPWWLCCGWSRGSRWCWLDILTRCKFKAICDRHDLAITGPLDEDDMTVDELRAAMRAGVPVEITPGPRPIRATLPDWAAEATVWRADTLTWAEAYDPDIGRNS
jgi:hypothetical protein